MEMGFPKVPSTCPTVRSLMKMWKRAKTTLGLTGYLRQTPIWWNHFYTDLNRVPNRSIWERAGVRFLTQILNRPVLKPFTQLLSEFPALKGHRFQYIQHAIRYQSRHSNLQLEESTFLESIYSDPEKKGIISRIYIHLLSHIQAPDLLPCREVGAQCWPHWWWAVEPNPGSGPLGISISGTETIPPVHTAQGIAVQLHKWGRRDSPICPKCHAHPGDLIHMLWRCPKLVRYWNCVVTRINSVFQVQLELEPLVCLLGSLEEDSYLPSVLIALTRLL